MRCRHVVAAIAAFAFGLTPLAARSESVTAKSVNCRSAVRTDIVILGSGQGGSWDPALCFHWLATLRPSRLNASGPHALHVSFNRYPPALASKPLTGWLNSRLEPGMRTNPPRRMFLAAWVRGEGTSLARDVEERLRALLEVEAGILTLNEDLDLAALVDLPADRRQAPVPGVAQARTEDRRATLITLSR